MEHKDLEKQFHCGPIKAAYENSKWFSGFMRVLFLLVAIYFFWLMMGEAHLVEHLDNWAVLAFCLWRMHRQSDIMCYVAEKGILVLHVLDGVDNLLFTLFRQKLESDGKDDEAPFFGLA